MKDRSKHGLARWLAAVLPACCALLCAQIPAAGPQRLRVAPLDQILAPGASLQLAARLEFFEGNGKPGGERDVTAVVQWSSDNPDLNVDANGMATASAGIPTDETAELTATLGRLHESVMLTISTATLSSITVTPSTPSVALGRKVQFVATGNYSSGPTHNLTDAVRWSSSAGTATIGELGLAATKSQGTATISATLGAVSGSTLLTVTAPVLDVISVTPQQDRLILPGTQQFTATGGYSDGGSQDLTTTAQWMSSNTGAATVGNTGLATGVAAGSTTISASFGGKTGSATVNAVALTSIAVSPVNPDILFGATQQFSAIGIYSDGGALDLTTTATWSSSRTGVATINSTGLASSIGEGNTTVQASQNGIQGSTGLAVDQVSVSISPASATVAAATTLPLQVKVSGALNTNVMVSVNNIPSGNDKVGAIVGNGEYHAPLVAPSPPTVTITAASIAEPSRFATATVTVGPAAVLPLALGSTWTYTCGNGVNITDQVTQTVDVNGHSAFALELQFPQGGTQTFLLNNDSQGNTTLYGYLVNGVVQAVIPTLYISVNAVPNQHFDYPAQGGGTVSRFFFGMEPTNPTPLGTFRVAAYNETAQKKIYGYASGVGIAEQDHGNFDCKISSALLHFP